MSKNQDRDLTLVVFVSQEIKSLYPLTNKRPIALQIIAGKRIVEWHLDLGKKVGATRYLFLCNKKDRQSMYEYLGNYMETSAPENEIGPFTIIDYDSEKGITKELSETIISEYLTKYSIWIDGNVIFSEDFLQKFVEKGFGTGKFAVVNNERDDSLLSCKGLGFFEKRYLEQALLKAKSVNEIYSTIRKKTASATLGLQIDEEMQFWQLDYPWQILDANEELIKKIVGKISGKIEKGATVIGEVVIGKGARIRAGSYLEGPLVIGEDCDIGPNCYIRKGVSLGKKVRVGNGCELKNIIADYDTHIAHLSYVGDSIIGEKCNFGAGTITGNLRLDDQTVKAKVNNKVLSTGRRKIGVIMGDNVKTAINVFLMPGVIVGSNIGIGTAVIVNRNIPNDSFVCIEQEKITREWKIKPKRK